MEFFLTNALKIPSSLILLKCREKLNPTHA